jgi:hypothetical protein
MYEYIVILTNKSTISPGEERILSPVNNKATAGCIIENNVQRNLTNSKFAIIRTTVSFFTHYDRDDEARCSKRTAQKRNTNQNKFIF